MSGSCHPQCRPKSGSDPAYRPIRRAHNNECPFKCQPPAHTQAAHPDRNGRRIQGEPSITHHTGDPSAQAGTAPTGIPALRASGRSAGLRTGPADSGPQEIIARGFAANLPGTLRSLRLALTTGDLAGSLESVRTLVIAAHGAGANDLEDLALELERRLNRRQVRDTPYTALPALANRHLNPIDQQALRYTHRVGMPNA